MNLQVLSALFLENIFPRKSLLNNWKESKALTVRHRFMFRCNISGTAWKLITASTSKVYRYIPFGSC